MAIRLTGTAIERNERRPQAAEEQEDDDHDQHERFLERLDHLVDRQLHEDRRVVDDLVLQPFGEALPQLVHASA